MSAERASICELLPSHVHLLEEHRNRLCVLAQVAAVNELLLDQLSFIVADLRGDFGQACLAEGAGLEFIVRHPPAAMVIPLDVDGLLAIATDTVPEALGVIADREPTTVPILIVDSDDEPAVVILDANELLGSA